MLGGISISISMKRLMKWFLASASAIHQRDRHGNISVGFGLTNRQGLIGISVNLLSNDCRPSSILSFSIANAFNVTSCGPSFSTLAMYS
jgi:hypothetical protein